MAWFWVHHPTRVPELDPVGLRYPLSLVLGIPLSMVLGTWTSEIAKIMDPILPILFILGYRAIILGSFGGRGR